MARSLNSYLKPVLPKRKANPKGAADTGTYVPANPDNVLTVPDYQEHLTDLLTSRQANDSRELMSELFKHDSDISATVNAYLTVADTRPNFYVRDMKGQLDRRGQDLLQQVMTAMFVRNDYSTGFQLEQSLRNICESMRYMVLLRGGVAAELVFDKLLVPREVRQVDLSSIEWFEKTPGVYKPVQTRDGADDIDLDIPNFFVEFYRKDPTEIYAYSPFVAAINTVAARQQVINDLYRIIQKTGFPRLEATVMEEILRKNIPSNIKQDDTKTRQWLNQQLTAIQGQLADLRSDDSLVHMDSVELSILNENGPKTSMDVKAVIEVLNAQNQAALKVMSTVIGRGESGVNTASTEARVFSMNAEQINHPIEELLSSMLTLALRLQGYKGYVEVRFSPVELRPDLELEPQRLAQQRRLTEALSYGFITDDEFHIKTFGRPKPKEAPELSGTNFLQQSNTDIDTSNISSNADPLGRSVTPEDSNAAKSN